MPSFKDADLAAIKARYESNYALITNDPKIANDPVMAHSFVVDECAIGSRFRASLDRVLTRFHNSE